MNSYYSLNSVQWVGSQNFSKKLDIPSESWLLELPGLKGVVKKSELEKLVLGIVVWWISLPAYIGIGGSHFCVSAVEVMRWDSMILLMDLEERSFLDSHMDGKRALSGGKYLSADNLMSTMKEKKPNFHLLRPKLLKAYESIHWLTLTKWFYEDYPEEDIWKDKRLWVHLTVYIVCQLTIAIFKVVHLLYEKNYFLKVTSLTGSTVLILVALRTYALYQFSTFRQLFFKPEIFNCNLHRPTTALSHLIKAMKHSRKVGLWCMVVVVTFDLSLLVLPIIPPILEIIDGTNKTYDELIPQYPSINPVRLSWLSKEAKYAFDLVMAVFNTIPWMGFVIVYYAVVQLFVAQHQIMAAAMTHGQSIPGDNQEPLELKLWIQDHVIIRKMIFEMRRLFSPALAGSICVNVFTVGLNMLALISSPIGPEAPLFTRCLFYFSFGTYSAISLSDIFIHCWLASEITKCGERLSYAFYQSDWHKDLHKTHDYVLPLMMCNKEIVFTALGMIPATMSTFTEAIRLSYSYYTLLRETG